MMRRAALIGCPLRRRHSQVMHDAAFVAHGIPARYTLRELGPAELEAFVVEARDPAWLGFQVTAPYKQDIMALIDRIEDEAASIGAVNSVTREDDGSLVGFNTDAPGFAAAVERDLGIGLDGTSVVVAGAGGAARAVVHAASAGGAAKILVASRRPAQAISLAESLAASTGAVSDCRPATQLSAGAAASTPSEAPPEVCALALDDPALPDALGSVDLVVNATTVGMLDPGTAVDPDAFGAGTAVFDLVYVPPETELLRRARERGLRAANGAEMLVAQAEIAFHRWTGVDDAAPAMRQAVQPLLAHGGPA